MDWWTSLEYRPAWIFSPGGAVHDHDLSIVLGSRYLFGRFGYRWVASRTETLEGPYLGLSVRW